MDSFQWHAPLRRFCAVILAAMVGILWSSAARADGEAWLWTEHQASMVGRGHPILPPTNMRFTTNARFSSRGSGLDFGLARAGPLFAIAPWLTTATTAAAIALRGAQGEFVQEYRAELDLVPHTKLGDFAITSRNRFEYIWREELFGGPFTRYRNMLRVAYAPTTAIWMPFAFADFFLRPTEPHFQELWLAIGMGRALNSSSSASRIDVGYLLRTRDGSGGELDHVLWLMVFFGAEVHRDRAALGGHGD